MVWNNFWYTKHVSSDQSLNTITLDNYPQWNCPQGNYPPHFRFPDNYTWIIHPGTQPPENYLPRISRDWTISPPRHTEWFPQGQLPYRQLPHHKILPRTITPQNNSPWTITPRQLLLFKFPTWTSNEKCFELSRFESELHLTWGQYYKWRSL